MEVVVKTRIERQIVSILRDFGSSILQGKERDPRSVFGDIVRLFEQVGAEAQDHDESVEDGRQKVPHGFFGT